MPHRQILLILVLILTLRLSSMWTPALIDTTEGRYASIAQEMVTSGNWLTPQIHLPSGLEPYQGKPPLHFWVTAVMLKLFGSSEFVARLPSFLGVLVCLSAVWVFAQRVFSPQVAALACVFFASSALSLLLSGSVHLDFTLSACISWMIVGFCLFAWGANSNNKVFGLIPFAAAALGLLTKGPIAIVLAAIVIVPILILRRDLKRLLKLPWIAGLLIFCALSAPWFYLQEQASPGFIRYFFINENLLRYVTKSYGDRYGEGHIAPYGSAILMLLYGTLPWSLCLLLCLKARFRPRGEWPIFAAWWGFAPALFFALSRQLLEAYMLPAYAGLAIFCAWLVEQASLDASLNARIDLFFKICSKIFFSLTIIILLGLIGAALGQHFGLANQFAPWMTPPRGHLVIGSAIAIIGLIGHERLRFLGAMPLAAKASLAFTTLFCTLLIVCGQFAADKKSTGPILSAIRSDHHDSIPLKVGIAFGKPFSAYFYDDAEPNDPIEIVRVDPNSDLILPLNLIVLKRDLSGLNAKLLAHYSVVREFPFWTWLKRTSGNYPESP